MAIERVVLACIVLLAGSQPATPWPSEPAEWSRQWRGSLGTRLKIEMELDRSYGGLSGSYTYEPSKDRLLLEGHVEDDGTVALTEQTADGDETGRFEGRFDAQGRFTGTWRDEKGVRALPFVLTPVPNPPQGAAKEWQGRWHEDAGTGIGAGEIVIKALADGRIRALGKPSRSVPRAVSPTPTSAIFTRLDGRRTESSGSATAHAGSRSPFGRTASTSRPTRRVAAPA
jgi:hypothetical protein